MQIKKFNLTVFLNILKKINFKKLFKRFFILCLILILFILTVNIYIDLTTKKRIYYSLEKIPSHKTALVLGAKVNNNGSLSHVFFDRTDTALKLYQKNKIEKILISGDNTKQDYDEVNAAKNYLLKNNVPKDDIFLDHAGIDTYDSVYRAKHIFEVKDLVIITQEFHLGRAIYLADSIELTAVGLAADQREYREINQYRLREKLARIKAFFNALLNSKPKFLGEKIPITGDSLKSWDQI